jgi:hypothetical protein
MCRERITAFGCIEALAAVVRAGHASLRAVLRRREGLPILGRCAVVKLEPPRVQRQDWRGPIDRFIWPGKPRVRARAAAGRAKLIRRVLRSGAALAPGRAGLRRERFTSGV